jgi:AraC-like DNA-binding protein
MPRLRTDTVRGLLGPAEPALRLARYFPSADLAAFVEHFWIVEWDRRGHPPLCQETLPHPCVHLVFEPDGAQVYGVMRGKFVRELSGQGRVFAVKFRPGAFYPILGTPLSTLTDRVLDAGLVFGPATATLAARLPTCATDAEQLALGEAFLRETLPAPDPTASAVGEIVERLLRETDPLSVDDLAGRLGLRPRMVQRLFSRYVGVSPKWVLMRARLHEAAERITASEPDGVAWARLAHELGYFDQAHFIHDFKTVVGRPPGAYVRRQRPV